MLWKVIDKQADDQLHELVQLLTRMSCLAGDAGTELSAQLPCFLQDSTCCSGTGASVGAGWAGSAHSSVVHVLNIGRVEGDIVAWHICGRQACAQRWARLGRVATETAPLHISNTSEAAAL